ncbi:Scr1 family TA system antitoxin-like transcriptional regulator [Streptomyces rubiginosohelvolus]|uniref:Scr1 family TA system antitoxin-like transcriptional regulator n=1 Tax=Streptomyces rubiginosohelvolus TaxID=67362 RepID=UPI0033D1B62F
MSEVCVGEVDDDFVAGVPDAVGHEFEVTNGTRVPLGRLCPPEKGGCSAHAHFAARAQYVGQADRTFHILLAEEALNTHLGGPEFMRGQLRRLVDAIGSTGPASGDYRGPCPHLGVYPGGGFSIFDDHRVEVVGYRGTETITDQDRVDLFRKAFVLRHSSAVDSQAARDCSRPCWRRGGSARS